MCGRCDRVGSVRRPGTAGQEGAGRVALDRPIFLNTVRTGMTTLDGEPPRARPGCAAARCSVPCLDVCKSRRRFFTAIDGCMLVAQLVVRWFETFSINQHSVHNVHLLTRRSLGQFIGSRSTFQVDLPDQSLQIDRPNTFRIAQSRLRVRLRQEDSSSLCSNREELAAGLCVRPRRDSRLGRSRWNCRECRGPLACSSSVWISAPEPLREVPIFREDLEAGAAIERTADVGRERERDAREMQERDV